LAAWNNPDDTDVGTIPMLGWQAVVMSNGDIKVVAYWPTNQILQGLTYGVESEGIKYSVDIPPMSNIDDWIKPVEIPPSTDVAGVRDIGKLFCYRHQLKLNLGCGDNKLPGWENFDIDIRAVDGVKPWAWNRPLPYADGTVSVVLVQHSLQHCKMEDYDSNFSEIRRVLEPGGKVVVKEADNRHYVWHRPGVTDRDGYIASSTSEPEVIQVLSRNGFSDIVTDRKGIVDRYGEAINRQKRLLGRQQLFVVEGTKAKGEVI
jgi:predicted SAM-dependent methyltransferase